MQRFNVQRSSGAIVAEGAEFTDGRCVLRWFDLKPGQTPYTVEHANIDSVAAQYRIGYQVAVLTGSFTRLFLLIRDEDPTGISGTGPVAEGVQFADGAVALRWLPTQGVEQTTVLHPSVDNVEALHGHNGSSHVEWSTSVGA